MSEKVYIAESVSVTTKGKITGISLRTYEATYKDVPTNYGSTRRELASTGKLFTIKDDQIIEKSTSANLSNKFIGWHNSDIRTKPTNSLPYGVTLFTTPEAALASKYLTIQNYFAKQKREAEAVIAEIEANSAEIPKAEALIKKFPELLI